MKHRPRGYSVSTPLSEKLRGDVAHVRGWVTEFNSERKEKFTKPLLWVKYIERDQEGFVELDLIGHLLGEEDTEFGRIVLTPYPEGITFTRIDCTLTDEPWALDYCSVLATHLQEVGGDKELSRLERGIIEVYEELRSNYRPTTDESIARALGEKKILNPQGGEYSRRWIIEKRKALKEKGYNVKS